MVSQQCLDKIKTKPEPLNRACTPSYCGDQNFIDGTHCGTLGLPMGEPFITRDPNFGGAGIAGYCYCCCSCFSAGTPIASAPDVFVLIEDINAGDYILGGGLTAQGKLEWKQAQVKNRSGDINSEIYPNMYLVKYQYKNEPEPRNLLVTPSHLFMMSSAKKLKAVQHLIPGDTLLTADGETAEILFVAKGEHRTSIHTIQMCGEFDGTNLDGHLLNANGVVTTDYAVQVYYETQELDQQHLYTFSDPENVYEVDTPEYIQQFHVATLDDFLNDEQAWPQGFFPKRKKLINVPVNAKRFLTQKQAEAVQSNAIFNAESNTVPNTDILRLFKLNQAFHPDIIYLIDWYDSLPNAYSWKSSGQNFILISGGLARVQRLYMEAFALIISVMNTWLTEAENIGEADYKGVAYDMRKIWTDSLYIQVVPAAIEQIRVLFQLSGDDNQPTTECRLQTYDWAISFRGIPHCAKTPPDYLEVLRATASPDLKEVTVFYDDPVEVSTATTTGNYQISDGITVTGAQIDPMSDKQVTLTVTGLQSNSKYLLIVSNVVSKSGAPLNSQKDTAILSTPAVF